MQQSSVTLYSAIESISQEKGIDPKVLVEAVEQAILTAAKRTFGITRELEAHFNEETGAVDLFQYMTVVEQVNQPECEIAMADAKRHGFDDAQLGEQLGFQIFYMPEHAEKARKQDQEFGDLLQLQQYRHGFGRIAAQTAKQVIIQRVRDAERDRTFNEYRERRGELISGVVRRFERGSNIIVDIGTQGGRNLEAILPSKEQTPRESYRPGDRITALLKDIDREARGPQVILSRSDVGLLVKLFEMEVPEIYEGIVRIVAAAREPGARSKIAVSSRDSDVDPVGACVGMKGSRVQAVVQELRGEKIDIVPWDRDPARFVCNAIAPAEVTRVIIDENNHAMELVVPDVKLSLAIGRRGQNVRLASQLTGWKLDIISESRFRQIEEEAIGAFLRIKGLEENVARGFYRAGFRSLDEVIDASEQELAQVTGLKEDALARLRTNATQAMEELRLDSIRQWAERAESMTDRDRMLLVRGVTERVIDQLEQAGYKTPEDIVREADVDRFAIRSGLGAERAQILKEGAKLFVETEWPPVEAQRRQNRERARLEAAENADQESQQPSSMEDAGAE